MKAAFGLACRLSGCCPVFFPARAQHAFQALQCIVCWALCRENRPHRDPGTQTVTGFLGGRLAEPGSQVDIQEHTPSRTPCEAPRALSDASGEGQNLCALGALEIWIIVAEGPSLCIPLQGLSQSCVHSWCSVNGCECPVIHQNFLSIFLGQILLGLRTQGSVK
jgi:hypothetical protein